RRQTISQKDRYRREERQGTQESRRRGRRCRHRHPGFGTRFNMNLTPVKPFEPIRTAQVPGGDGWIAQVKWDGVRMLTYCDGNETRLTPRRPNGRTRQYPELAKPAAWCMADSFVLDGEVIALKDGLPSFYAVMKRDNLRSEAAILQAAGLI